MKAVITFDIEPRINYTITFKKVNSAIWIIPPGNPTKKSPFFIGGLDPSVVYDFKIESPCGIITFQGEPQCPSVTGLHAVNI